MITFILDIFNLFGLWIDDIKTYLINHGLIRYVEAIGCCLAALIFLCAIWLLYVGLYCLI